jgi:hypothetical protein
MKKLTVEYRAYKLEVEIHSPTNYVLYSYIKGTCESLSFVRKANYGDYQDIIYQFMKKVDEEAQNESLVLLDY